MKLNRRWRIFFHLLIVLALLMPINAPAVMITDSMGGGVQTFMMNDAANSELPSAGCGGHDGSVPSDSACKRLSYILAQVTKAVLSSLLPQLFEFSGAFFDAPATLDTGLGSKPIPKPPPHLS